MTESILAIDPGESTGWSLWALEPEYPMQRLECGLVHGGEAGFITFMEVRLGRFRPSIVVCEEWNINDGRRGNPRFSLRIEGALMAMTSALGIELVFQPTSMKDMCRDSVLKEHGLWITNKQAREDPQILWQDARDVNDSQINALAWAKAIGHDPTIEAFWPDV